MRYVDKVREFFLQILFNNVDRYPQDALILSEWLDLIDEHEVKTEGGTNGEGA